MLLGIIVLGKFLLLVGEKVLSHCYFIATPSLLHYKIEQRKMIFYNKTLHSNNIVLRILCALQRNEARKLSSVYHIFLDTRAVLTLIGPFGQVL